jgi:hypothetical protein
MIGCAPRPTNAAEMINMLATSTRGKWERGGQQEEQPTSADGSHEAAGNSFQRRLPPAAGVRPELEGSSTTERRDPTVKVGFHWWDSRSRTKCRRLALFRVGCIVRVRERNHDRRRPDVCKR